MPDSARLRGRCPDRFVGVQRMPTLRQLADQHGTLLVLDACSSRVHAGWCPLAGAARWQSVTGEAGIALFQALEGLGHPAADAGAWVYCDGPGSILGIRTAAMAIRAWSVLAPKPVYAYHSLTLLVAGLGDPEVTAIADARRDRWHCVSAARPLGRVPTAALPGKLVRPDGFRVWSALPHPVATVPYDVPDLLSRVADVDLFRSIAAPDAFLHEEPSYAKWTPQIHRAP